MLEDTQGLERKASIKSMLSKGSEVKLYIVHNCILLTCSFLQRERDDQNRLTKSLVP